MAIELNDLLDKIPQECCKALGEQFNKARNGDFDSICILANLLRLGASKNDDLELAKRLYQYLDEHNIPCFKAFIWDIDHSLNPSFRFSELEVEQQIDWCVAKYWYIYPLLVKAIQSDDALFQKYHKKAIQIYKEWYDDPKLTCWVNIEEWYWTLMADPRVQPCYEQVEAMQELKRVMTDKVDPYIALKHIEVMFALMRREGKMYDFSKAFDNLQYSFEYREDYLFYRGMIALYWSKYKSAIHLFSKGTGKRCRLALAYCLINGIGWKTDQEAGRAIVNDYPDDPYALYLKAVSLFREADRTKPVPAEILEIMDKSSKLGYKPAAAYGLLMQFCHAIRMNDEEQINRCTRAMHIMDDKVDPEVHAVSIYKCYIEACELYAQHKDIIDARKTDNESDNDIVMSFLVLHCAIKYPYHDVPLSYYTQALENEMLSHKNNNEFWVKALRGFNQSPVAKYWGLGRAMIHALTEYGDFELDNLIRLFVNYGATAREVAIWTEALHVSRYASVPDVYEVEKRGYIDRHQVEEADGLEKLLAVKIGGLDNLDESGLSKVRTALVETENRNNLFVSLLRNDVIRHALASNDFQYPMDQFVLLDHHLSFIEDFIGYDFFDYDIKWANYL